MRCWSPGMGPGRGETVGHGLVPEGREKGQRHFRDQADTSICGSTVVMSLMLMACDVLGCQGLKAGRLSIPGLSLGRTRLDEAKRRPVAEEGGIGRVTVPPLCHQAWPPSTS
jgi:hypothetical protein